MIYNYHSSLNFFFSHAIGLNYKFTITNLPGSYIIIFQCLILIINVYIVTFDFFIHFALYLIYIVWIHFSVLLLHVHDLGRQNGEYPAISSRLYPQFLEPRVSISENCSLSERGKIFVHISRQMKVIVNLFIYFLACGLFSSLSAVSGHILLNWL